MNDFSNTEHNLKTPNYLVSVIVPCYNQVEFLTEALDSVLAQTYQNWECIIINDGSTDNTQEVALQYCKKDSRFKYIEKKNGGLSSARNAGLKMAKGEFIQLLDCDDIIQFEKLNKHTEILINNKQIDLVYSDLRYFQSSNPNIYYKSFHLTNEDWLPKLSGKEEIILSRLIMGNIMACNCPLFRQSCLKKTGYFNEILFNHEDYEFWNRFALAGFYFHYDDQHNTNALVRLHNKSMSRNSKMDIGFTMVQLKLFIELCKGNHRIHIDENSIRNQKRKLTKLYLLNEIKREHLFFILNFYEKIRLPILGLVPKKFKYQFLMFDLQDLYKLI